MVSAGTCGSVRVCRRLVAGHVAGRVLAAHRVLERHRPDRPQQLGLLVAHRLGVEGRRRLHRHQRQHLQQVVLDDVADDPRLLVEGRPGARPRSTRPRSAARGRRSGGSRSARRSHWRSGTRRCSGRSPCPGSGRCGRSARSWNRAVHDARPARGPTPGRARTASRSPPAPARPRRRFSLAAAHPAHDHREEAGRRGQVEHAVALVPPPACSPSSSSRVASRGSARRRRSRRPGSAAWTRTQASSARRPACASGTRWRPWRTCGTRRRSSPCGRSRSAAKLGRQQAAHAPGCRWPAAACAGRGRRSRR